MDQLRQAVAVYGALVAVPEFGFRLKTRRKVETRSCRGIYGPVVRLPREQFGTQVAHIREMGQNSQVDSGDDPSREES